MAAEVAARTSSAPQFSRAEAPPIRSASRQSPHPVFDANRPKEGIDDVLKGEIQSIAKRQSEIQEMTIKILERTESP